MFVFLIALALVKGQVYVNAQQMPSMAQCEVAKDAVSSTIADGVSLECKALDNLESLEQVMKNPKEQ